MPSKPRITIGEEDLAPEITPATPSHAPDVPSVGPHLPPVQARQPTAIGVGAPAGAPRPSVGDRRLLRDARTAPLVAAAVGMAIGWAVAEITGLADASGSSRFGLDVSSGIWTALIGAFFVAVIAGFPLAVEGAWEAARGRALRAAGPGFGIAFVAGFLAQALYGEIFTHVFTSALERGDIPTAHAGGFYFARCLGWAIFGAGIGASLGGTDRSKAKAINGALGGAVGGAAGGLLFQFITAVDVISVGASRLLGLVGIGLCIAVATRAVESIRREAWLTVVEGGMTGKEFVLYHPTTRIGASPECELFLLKDPAVAPLHAQITDDGAQRVLGVSPGQPVLLNGAPTEGQVLRSGDRLQFGSTVIAYSERALAPA